MRMTTVASGLAVATVLAGCGATGSGAGGQGGQGGEGVSVTGSPSGPAGPSGSRPPASAVAPEGVNVVDAGYTGRFRAFATVLERGDAGPQLCLGAIATSYPPQCGGPPVVGWDWSKVQHEQASGVRWGSYLVVGRFDGTRFTLTEPARTDDGGIAGPTVPGLPDFRSRCPEPAGGWVPPDPAKATDDALQQATVLVEKQPGYAALWIDQNEAAVDPSAGPSAGFDNSPTRIILNVRTTGDVAVMERAVRAVWGGNLCVSQGRRTYAELLAVQSAVERTPGFLGSGPDVVDGWVDLTVIRATRQLQDELDRAHGPGAVRLIGALEPVD